MFDQTAWDHYLFLAQNRGVSILRILLIAFLASRLCSLLTRYLVRVLDARDRLAGEGAEEVKNRHRKTIYQVFDYGARILIYFIAVFAIVEQIGVNIGAFAIPATILASGIGFGVQTIFRDFFSGFLIVGERLFATGEVVKFVPFGTDQDEVPAGDVESVSLRRTQVRQADGELITYPNGSILQMQVVNLSRDWAFIVIHYPTPEDQAEREFRRQVVNGLEDYLDKGSGRDLIERDSVETRIELVDGEANVVIIAKAKPGKQFSARRLMQRHIDQHIVMERTNG